MKHRGLCLPCYNNYYKRISSTTATKTTTSTTIIIRKRHSGTYRLASFCYYYFAAAALGTCTIRPVRAIPPNEAASHPTTASFSKSSNSIPKRTMSSFSKTSSEKMNNNNNNKSEKQDDNNDDDPWRNVGGNAVNEKTRRPSRARYHNDDDDTTAIGFDPQRIKSHLYHALEGLDRYPNYLSRWNDDGHVALDRLEGALREALDKVQGQRARVATHRQEMEALVQDFWHCHPEYQTLVQRPSSWHELQQSVFDPQWSRAIVQSWKRQQKRQLSSSSSSPSRPNAATSSSPPPLPWQEEAPKALTLEAAQLEPLMDQVVPDVYSLPLLQPSYCQKILAYLRDLSAFRQERYHRNVANHTGQHASSSSSLHTRWIDLDHVGLSWLNDVFMYYAIQPLSRHLFQAEVNGVGGGSSMNTNNDNNNDDAALLDWRQGYLAAYTTPTSTDQMRPRQGLTVHSDDSEVTLNLSLNGGAFDGGDLAFYGLRGTPEEGRPYDDDESYTPVAGRAIVHPGRYLHAVTDLRHGERYALIVWARSWQGIRATTCPCCWLQRRTSSATTATTSSSCICGAAWN